MIYRTSYPWYIKYPIHAILNLLPMLFHTPSHGISATLSMVLSTSDPWHIGPLTNGILLLLTHGILNPYTWHIEPTTYGISNPILMVHLTPYPWYIEPPIHGISNPLQASTLTYCLTCPFGQLTKTRGSQEPVSFTWL